MHVCIRTLKIAHFKQLTKGVIIVGLVQQIKSSNLFIFTKCNVNPVICQRYTKPCQVDQLIHQLYEVNPANYI